MIKNRHAGKIYMVVSAFLSATGQLFWKISHFEMPFLAIGFVCYGIGSFFMLKGLSLEKLSIAYPMMCLSYVFALAYGDLLLGEDMTLKNGIAVVLIGVGVTLTSYDK